MDSDTASLSVVVALVQELLPGERIWYCTDTGTPEGTRGRSSANAADAQNINIRRGSRFFIIVIRKTLPRRPYGYGSAEKSAELLADSVPVRQEQVKVRGNGVPCVFFR